MGPTFYFFIYLVVWWLVLFAILPLGVRSHHEEGVDVPGGGEPGSPTNPNLKRKFITTTWVSLIVLALIWVVLTFNLIPIPDLPSGPSR
jgi:predicted secreted protein